MTFACADVVCAAQLNTSVLLTNIFSRNLVYRRMVEGLPVCMPDRRNRQRVEVLGTKCCRSWSWPSALSGKIGSGWCGASVGCHSHLLCGLQVDWWEKLPRCWKGLMRVRSPVSSLCRPWKSSDSRHPTLTQDSKPSWRSRMMFKNMKGYLERRSAS